MSFKQNLAAQLPYLRRYARTISGSQKLGDAAVRETLEALLEAPEQWDETAPIKFELFRVFHRNWSSDVIATLTSQGRNGVVSRFPAQRQQSLLLFSVEGFTEAEVAAIIGISEADVKTHVFAAHTAITDAMRARVLIIEDESIIAHHIKQIVERVGHETIGIVRTRAEAVTKARDQIPELILADLSLADGTSGVDAIKDILAAQSVPVVFITAYPERLLTGKLPEPTYLITKPFEPETVVATIGQALLMHRDGHTVKAA